MQLDSFGGVEYWKKKKPSITGMYENEVIPWKGYHDYESIVAAEDYYTVYLAGELKYRYVYETDTIYKDVPVIDREGSIAETVRDWNRTREYDRLLFDNEFGKLTIVLSVQYNELQKLSYFFTPMYKEITIIKKRVLYPLFRLLSHI